MVGFISLALMPKCKHWYSYFFYRDRVTLCVCVGGGGGGGSYELALMPKCRRWYSFEMVLTICVRKKEKSDASKAKA